MKRLALALTGLSALALAACATLAPYGAQMGPNGQGYSEQRIESNRYRVTYNGVGAAGRVADWALVRAADLTTEQCVIANGCTSGNADLGHNHASLPDLDIMPDLDKVIDPCAHADNGIRHRAAVDCGVGTDFCIAFDNHAPELWHLHIA